jgi:hypothetical protein
MNPATPPITKIMLRMNQSHFLFGGDFGSDSGFSGSGAS